jgi:chromosomal replication initiation ATPase DnaA
MVGAPALMIKLGRVLGIVGTDVVMAKLDEIERDSPESYNQKIERFIVDEVCIRYNVSRESLNKNRVDGDCLLARNLCFVLIEKHVEEYSMDKVAKIFGKQASMVSIAIKQFSNMRPHIKHEREFLTAYNEINTKVKEFKKDLII